MQQGQAAKLREILFHKFYIFNSIYFIPAFSISNLINVNSLSTPGPIIISGLALMTSVSDIILSLANSLNDFLLKISLPPAIFINSETHLIPTIRGSSHSSKYTFKVL